MGNMQSMLGFLEEKVNTHKLIKREPIRVLFASDKTLKEYKNNPSIIDEEKFFINSNITMLGLDNLGNIKSCKSVDGLEVCNNKGILLIEAKDITTSLLLRLEAIANDDENLNLEGIIDNRLKEVSDKLKGSVTLLNSILKQINEELNHNDDCIFIGLFIDYKLTDVDEFGLTGDIGLLREKIDQYSESKREAIIFTNKKLKAMEEIIESYSKNYNF